MSDNTKIETCPLCGGEEAIKLYDANDLFLGLPGDFQLCRCPDCEVFFTLPRMGWNEMSAYYSNTYNLGKDNSAQIPLLPEMSERRKNIIKQTAEKKFRLIKRFGGTGKLLDVGCNMGHFLFGMQMLGWSDLHGLEPSPAAADFAGRSLGIPVVVDIFPEMSAGIDQQFDVVTLWHVFEHLEDPRAALKTLKQLLTAEGICLICIPNPDSIERKYFGRYWAGFEVPRHYFAYPPQTLKTLANEMGFDVLGEELVDDPHGAIMFNISLLLKQSGWYKLWRPIERVLSTGLFGKISAPFYKIAVNRGFRPSLAYVLKPRAS